MSLRKSPPLSPQRLAANRKNAQLSTGPRAAAGKQNSKFNAVKHGAYAADENHRQVMLALGEDPEKFEALKQQLMTAYGPGDALWETQIDDLAKLYWRRDRLERAQTGMMRRALQAVEDWQHQRRQEMAGATFDASQPDSLDLPMAESADPGVRLRKLLSFLEVIREQVRQRTFGHRQLAVLEASYRNRMGWRAARLCMLLRFFAEFVEGRKREYWEGVLEELAEEDEEQAPRDEQMSETQYQQLLQELLRLLDEEIAAVQEEFQYAEKVNEEKAAIERDACLAPAGEEWKMMLRQEAALDRSIDRKVRILLALRKGIPDSKRSPAPAEEGDETAMENMENVETILGIDITSQASASQGDQCRVPPNEVQVTTGHHPLAPSS